MSLVTRAREFRTKKTLGQNFLVDENIINRIIDAANINKEDIVLEIGAGAGFVTERLVKLAKKVIAIEIDERAVKVLNKIDCDNLEIINEDILKVDLSTFSDKKIKVVANIPYYITTPILVHLLGEIDDLYNKNRNAISEIVLMVQYEVAKRIVATNNSNGKEYGLLSILSQFWADIEFITRVDRRSFYPAPKVNSGVLLIKPRECPLVELNDYKLFKRVIKSGFGKRRKNIKNSLQMGGFSKDTIENILKALEIDLNTRAENLSIEDFKNIALEIEKNEPNKS